jgi:GWxTD domain-containing protein
VLWPCRRLPIVTLPRPPLSSTVSTLPLRVAGLVVLLLCAASLSPLGRPRLEAQTMPQRDSLDALQDSLREVTDTVALGVLERSMIEVTRVRRHEGMLHLRLGLISLRLAELGRRGAADDAAGEFQWATELEPTWPWSWYGLGLAEYAILDSEVAIVAGLQAMFGRDRLTRAAELFAKSAEVDPSFVQGLTDLVGTALQQRMNLRLEVALEALRRSARGGAANDPRVLLVRGRIEREVGELDSAIVAFRSYLTVGGNGPLGRYELGRTQLTAGQLEGRASYYEAARGSEPIVDSAMRADLVDMVGDTALVPLDSLRGPAREGWLRNFWGRRDQEDLRRPGERMAEHYRRLQYARRNFRLVSPKRQYRIEERYRSFNRDYDDRGLIYIRHGEPTDRVSITHPDLPHNQTWKYARPEGDLIFHFVAREDVQDFKLVESVYDIMGFDAAIALRSGLAAPGLRGQAMNVLQSRQTISPMYGRLMAAGGAAQGVMDRERRVGQQSIATGTTGDSYLLHFSDELTGSKWSVMAAGERDGQGVVHVTWAVPSTALRAVPSSRGVLYPVHLRISLIDLATGQLAATIDSTTMFGAAQPVPRGEWLVGRQELTLPPGRYRWRVALQEGEAGVLSPPDTLEVATPGQLGLSDIVLGARHTNLTWLRSAEDTVFFNPVGTFRSGGQLELFYEVLGIPAGGAFRTQVRVSRPGGIRLFGRGSAISVRQGGESAGPRSAQTVTLDLGRLRPGPYTLEVTVEREGEQVRRRASFTVVAPASP